MQDIEQVKVWDIGVRLFHWSLVVSFVVAYISADEENIIHIYSGYVVLGLVMFRVLWGIVGSQYARFSDFIYGPKKVISYILGLVSGKAEHYLGHNPLGGLMVVIMLACLLVVTVSGLKLYAIEEGRGPLAGTDQLMLIENAYADRDEYEKHDEKDQEDAEELWEELHEVSTNVMLFLICLHILGVIISSRLHDENLIKAMINGFKVRKD